MPFRTIAPLLVLAAGLAAGCGPNTSTTPTPTDTSVTINVYAGPLDPGGSSRYIVTLSNASTLQVMLAGEQLLNPLRTLDVPLEINISDWDGSNCTPLDSNVTVPKLTSQLQRFLAAGSYCVQVIDPGNLTETIGSVVRISYPAPKRFQGTGSPVTLESTLTPGGQSSKTFVLSTAGTITATLNSAGANNDAVMGFGLGVVPSDSNVCTLTHVIEITPGSPRQISAPADAGIYCAAVFDSGATIAPTDFSFTIEHP
jgi:hypothetical protein